MRFFTAMILILSLSSCAVSAQKQKKIDDAERTVPVCTGDDDCQAKWEAAQLWIVHNCGFKLQLVTTVLLETYTPAGNSPLLGARVTKEPTGTGSYRIIAKLACDNFLGCRPDELDALLDFNKTVSAAGHATKN